MVNFKLSIDQFRSLLNLNDRDKMVDELQKRYRVPKKEGTELIGRFKDVVNTLSLF